MTVTYEVGHGGQMDIDFYVSQESLNSEAADRSFAMSQLTVAASIADVQVTAPSGQTIVTQTKQSQGTFSTTATSSGRYTYCFSNEMSSYATKTVSFNVHGVLYSDQDEMGPVEEEIRDLASGLQLVKDEQAYLVVRERVHRNTCESTVSNASTTSTRTSSRLPGSIG